MYIESETETEPIKLATSLKAALAVAALLVMLIGVYPQPLIPYIQRAAASQGLKTYDYAHPPQPSPGPPGAPGANPQVPNLPPPSPH
jgi:hypothetical protein